MLFHEETVDDMYSNVRSYVLSELPLTYNEAKSMCQEIGGQLALQVNIQTDFDVILQTPCSSMIDLAGFWTKPGENKSNVCHVTQPGRTLQCKKENKRKEFPYLCNVQETEYDPELERCTVLYSHTTEMPYSNISTPTGNSTIMKEMTPESSSNTGAIIGAVLCVVVVALVVTALGLIIVKRRRKKEEQPDRKDSIKYEGTLQPEQQYYNTDETSYTPLRRDQGSIYYSEAKYEGKDEVSGISKRNDSVENILKKQGMKPGNLGCSGEHDYIIVMDSSKTNAVNDGELYDLAVPIQSDNDFEKDAQSATYDMAKPAVQSMDKEYSHRTKDQGHGNVEVKHFQKHVNKPMKEKSGKPYGQKSKHGKESDDENLRYGEIRRVRSKIRHFNKLFS